MTDKRHWKRSSRFGLVYGIVLAVFTAYVLLDTFVIPKKIAAVSTAADSSAEETFSSGTSGVASDLTSGVSAADSGDTAASVSGAVITDTSYDDDNISISISTARVSDTACYLVDIRISDVSYLKAAFADDTFGRNIKEKTSVMAEEHSAILAINGDYCGFRDYGYVLRNGVLYRDASGNDEDLVIDADGSMRIIGESSVTAASLEEENAWQVLSFGPALVNDGEIAVGVSDEVDQAMNSNPRTAIGMISPLHYLIVVSDGRTDESRGLTLYELAQIFADKGASVAYNLDGGGSSTLWFNGRIINNPAGGRSGNKERAVSDILYIG